MKNQQTANSDEKKGNGFFTPKRIFLGVLGLGALGFGFWAVTRKGNKPGTDPADDQPAKRTEKNTLPPPVKPAPKPKTSPAATDYITTKPASDFPLKKGSRGEKVLQLKQALNLKYPGLLKNTNNKFDDETEKALLGKSLPKQITEAQFKIITAIDPETTAKKLYDAARAKKFSDTLAVLASLRTTDDYEKVNEKFKPFGLINGMNTTIVTGLFLTFTDQNQKDRLAIEFTRMGLVKDDSGKWSIPKGMSGVEPRSLITTRPTKVWKDARHMVQVGADTVLGYEVQSENGITVFDTIDGYRLFVMTGHVKYY